MSDRGYSLVSGGTENHLMLVDLIGRSVTGKDAEAALGEPGGSVEQRRRCHD